MVLKYYKEFCLNNSKTNSELEAQQCAALKQMIKFCFDKVPYYQKLFNSAHVTPNDFHSIADLENLPILTKQQIKNATEDFWPANFNHTYIDKATGGSTGVPLRYRLSHDCWERGYGLFYRGWGFAGYKLGDKVAIIAGASLLSGQNSVQKKIQSFIMNFHSYSSYGMDDNTIDHYVQHLNKRPPLYIYGYASALYLLAKYIEEKKLCLKFKPKGVFSTSEVLYNQQRDVIERIFQSKVFNVYGLNDGGVSAFECHNQNGMHIDYERSILQTVDDNGRVIEDSVGRIIATSLYNYAMPLIRYDTGDLGLIDSKSECNCGCKRPLLKSVYGRVTDYLKLNGKMIGSPVLTVLMGQIDVEYYQVKQVNVNEIDISYIKGAPLNETDMNFVSNSFFDHVGNIKINFKKVNPGDLSTDNKHKFIINEVCR